MNIQNCYQKALAFAARKHSATNETVKGTDLPYIVHVVNVAMEILVAAPQSANFDLPYTVQVALLHDTVEDTATSIDEIEQHFGKEIAAGVDALTKNEELAANQQIADSVQRIKLLHKEVWAVKLADRIANLLPPPADWDDKKIQTYISDSIMIHQQLGEANVYLSQRLTEKIEEYRCYLQG